MNVLHPCGELRRSKVIVLLRDGDELVRITTHELLHRIPDKPVFLRRALIEVETVGGIEHLGAALADFSRCQPPHNTAHRRIAVDHIVAAIVNDLFQLFIGTKIFGRKRRPLERHGKDLFHKIQLQTVLLGKVVPRRYMNFTAVLVQHCNQRLVELANMRLYGGN